MGIVLGITVVAGGLYGLWRFAPQVLVWASGSTGDGTAVKGMVEDLLRSELAKDLVTQIIDERADEMVETFLIKALESSQFRKALAQALESFLKTPEGRSLVRKIAEELLVP